MRQAPQLGADQGAASFYLRFELKSRSLEAGTRRRDLSCLQFYQDAKGPVHERMDQPCSSAAPSVRRNLKIRMEPLSSRADCTGDARDDGFHIGGQEAIEHERGDYGIEGARSDVPVPDVCMVPGNSRDRDVLLREPPSGGLDHAAARFDDGDLGQGCTVDELLEASSNSLAHDEDVAGYTQAIEVTGARVLKNGACQDPLEPPIDGSHAVKTHAASHEAGARRFQTSNATAPPTK